MTSSTHSTEVAGARQSYAEGALPTFTPIPWYVSLNEIRAAIPQHLFTRQTWRGLLYVARDLIMAAFFLRSALRIDSFYGGEHVVEHLTVVGAQIARLMTWLLYWLLQGLIFTGIWVIGHECGHTALSGNKHICNIVGYIAHTILLTPYFSWKITHHRHHIAHASMERDQLFVPRTRSDLGIPSKGQQLDYEDYFGDTPLYALTVLIVQQLLAFPVYLACNISGQKNYPRWTNHFNPNCVLFTKNQRSLIIISDLGILFMMYILKRTYEAWGATTTFKVYGVPWFCVSHWLAMITYLHHTDPELPHYRRAQWNFQRGAAATMDRDFLGYIGRFFFHDVAHFHVVHHFFPKIPFYHAEEATRYLQAFIGEHYRYSEKPVFEAFWHNVNECKFIEDEGDILFYRNKKGQAALRSVDVLRE
ncbi:fatty acid desaturase-domain-containing protein [Sparassis latifolia]